MSKGKLTLSEIDDRLKDGFTDLTHRYNESAVPITDEEHRNFKGKVTDILVRECKFPLEFVADGAFRNVYRILGTPYVLKVPSSSRSYVLDHAAQEVKAYQKIKRSKSLAALRPYLPKFHLVNDALGIILTDYIRPVQKEYGTYYGKYYNEIQKVSQVARSLSTAYDPDLGVDKADNWGVVGGKLKILDLGCFTGASC